MHSEFESSKKTQKIIHILKIEKLKTRGGVAAPSSQHLC